VQASGVAFTSTDARSYILKARWQFARTMPQWPHEYTVRNWHEDLEEDFLAFVELIHRDGVVKPWPRDSVKPRYHHSYLEIDRWEYWTMGEPVAETTLINRARVESGPDSRADRASPEGSLPEGYSMTRTVITHPDGSVTTVQSRSGCAQGCAWVFWVLLAVFVVAFPAENFPLWGAIIAYVVEGAIALAGLAAWVQRHKVEQPKVN